MCSPSFSHNEHTDFTDLEQSAQDDNDALHQLEDWASSSSQTETLLEARRPNGRPYESLTSVLTVGRHGPPMLCDTNCVELLQNFTRSSVPPRVVHDKGTGAHGYLQLTNSDLSRYSRASLFRAENVGRKIQLFGRFATTAEKMRADSTRTFWTWSIKIYTEDGNQDFLCLQTPIFNIRDPLQFVPMNSSLQANPVTPINFGDPNTFFDFVTQIPEALHFLLFLHSDRGLPLSFRHMNAFPINIFKLVNAQGDYFYARFQFKTNQGIRYLTDEEASVVRRIDPDFAIRDIYNAIRRGDFPSYTMFVQIMDKDEPLKYEKRSGWDAFDNTKIWPQSQYPLIEVGRIVFDRNLESHFNENAQSAFNPANLIPGIEAAMEDRIFSGRIFAYEDSQLYRLGRNKSMIPINKPKGLKEPLRTYYGRCPMNLSVGREKHYFSNVFGGAKAAEPRSASS